MGARANDMNAAHPVGPTSGTWAQIRPPGAAREPPGPPKGALWAKVGPFGGPGGPWPALGDLIWAQLPLVGPTGWATWLGCYMYSLGHIGPPFQPQGPPKGYLAPIPSVLSPHFGSNFISGRI